MPKNIDKNSRIYTRYDKHANLSGFKEGSKVWLYNPTRKKGIEKTIIARINDVVYYNQCMSKSGI